MELPSLRIMCACTNAVISQDGKLSLIDIFDALEVDSSATSGVSRRADFRLVFRFQRGETGGTYNAGFKVVAPSGAHIAEVYNSIKFDDQGQAGVIIHMNIELPELGKHCVEVWVDNTLVGSFDVTVRTKQESELPLEGASA